MNIYNKDGSLLLSVPVTSNAKYVRELAGDCYILLSWYAPYGTPLDAGTYIEHNGAKYALLDTYTPRMNTEASWLYEPQFKPQEMAWSKIPFFFYNGDSRESDWTLTSDAPDFLECVLKAIKNETGEEYTFSTDVTGTITLQFSSTDILSGLNQIADGFKTEWWVKDKVIHLSRCIDDTKTEITLSIGENVGIPSVSEKSEGYYNRFYVFGSTRNIVQGYSGANVNNLTNKRLTLDPVKYPNGYYQLTDGTFSKVLIYEDIYPAATNIEIVSLMSRTDYVLDDNGKKIQIGTDSEGNPIWDMFTVWYMKIAYKNSDGTYTDFEFNDWNYTDDPNVHAGKEGMLIPGLKVSVSFASGPLMGREFELAYIKSDTTIKTSSGSIIVPKGYFEILYTKENDYIIPDSAYLVPVEGNNVVLFNIKMPDIYIQDAYDRLEAAMKKDIEEKYLSDLNQYTFETYPGAFGSIDIGAPVAFGTLKTRVVSVSYNLETPSVFEITIGNELQKGTIQQLVDDTLTANKNIEIIAALNKTTEAIANAYTRTYQEILKQFDLISSIFELDTTSVAGKTLIHAKYDGLYSDGDIAAGGAWAGTPSGGGKTYLNELLDVQLATSSLNVGDMLMWNGDKYVNIPQSSITPDLSAYATQQWVLDKKYLTSVPVASVVGQTGNITTAQVATALTDAGYKLTDTTYELATTTSNGLMSATDKTKLNGIAENANNYTLPTASSDTKGGIKVGTTLSISGEVLNLKSGFPKGTYTKVQIDDYGRVSSGSTLSASDIPSLPWSKITTGKPTTISGYGITDAYTKTETDNKVAELQSLLDSMFERVYDSNNKLIRIHSNVTISSSGDLVAGGNSEGGGTSGGAYTQLEWNAIKALTQSESGLLASAYAVKEAYNELNTAIETLAGKATNVTFTQTLTSGKQIGSISIDGKSTSLFAPANYAWSEVTGKPTFATVATSGSYSDLTNKPTIASLMGSTAIGGTSSYLYWNGSAWATKALGTNAFTSISKVSQLTNDSGYITGITKAMVEDVLTGNITSHTHSYLPLAGGTMSNTNVVTNLNADLLDGYHASSLSKIAAISLTLGQVLRIDMSLHTRGLLINAQSTNTGRNALYFVAGYGDGTTIRNDIRVIKGGPYDLYFNGTSEKGCVYIVGTSTTGYSIDEIYINPFDSKDIVYSIVSSVPSDAVLVSSYNSKILATLNSNVASASKWETARTITLTGSVTGSVSIDGSANVSLVTTTNHTHNYLPLSGGTITSEAVAPLALKSTSSSGHSILQFISGETYLGALGFKGLNDPYFRTAEGRFNTLIHSGNYNSYSPKLDGTGATGTWGISISGNAATATNADKLDGYHATMGSNQPWGTIPGITSKGWMDVGRQFEFHYDNTYSSDYSTMLRCTGNYDNIVDLPSASGTLALLTDNVASASKLATSRTIWGQSFDGTGNVDGSIKIKDNVGLYHLTPDGVYRCYVGYDTNNLYVHIYNFRSGSSIRINDDGNICIPSGNVGIGTTSPSYKLHIVGTAYATENIIAAGDLTAGSDIRYKDKIQDLRLTVHDIALAPAFTYKWNNRKDDALIHIGSSAQYWLNTDAKDAVYYDKQNDFYHLNYASLALCNTIILARGMETQEEKIARLEERIKELEDKLRQYDSCR